MRVNWCRTCGDGRNFGDQLGPVLLRHHGVRVEWAPPETAELVTVGSLLGNFPAGWRGTILGTGFIRGRRGRDLSSARALAVRGALSREDARLSASVPLGDPGILVPDLYPDVVTNGGGELVIPHYVDRALATRHPDAAHANILAEPRDLLTAIAGASLVFTSSLHALIAADALGVPHVLEPHPEVHGGLYKFTDYASAFDETIEPGKARLTDRAAMAARQSEIRSLFAELVAEVAA
jgi:pyruvyltransferase